MIPRKLSLRNFMSYGEQAAEVDFAGMHVVSLSGDNGNGKSALLDAMTYALWGKTRTSGVASATDDDLIRLGADNMEVIFEFELNDDIYRSVRKRKRGGSSDWQVNISDASGTWRPLTNSGITASAHAIETILRMTHDTFLNSAYIQQGRSDEFTRQKADKRKQILADILDLERYDKLEGMARSRRISCESDRTELDGEIQVYQSQIDRADEVVAKLEEARKASELAAQSLGSANQKLEVARSQFEALKARQDLLVGHRSELAKLQREIGDHITELAARQSEAQQRQSIIGRRDEIERDHKRWSELKKQIADLELQLRPIAGAGEALKRAEASIRAEEASLRQLLDSKTRERTALAGRKATLDAKLIQLSKHRELAATLPSNQKEKAETETAYQKSQDEFATLKGRKEQLDSLVAEANEVIGLLESPRPTCPVCETDLSGGRQEKVITSQRKRLADYQTELTSLISRAGEVKRERARLDELKTAIAQQVAASVQAANLVRDLETETANFSKELAQLPVIEQEISLTENTLSLGDFAQATRIELTQLQKNVEALGRIESQITGLRNELLPLETKGIEDLKKRLDHATVELAGFEKEISRLTIAITKFEKEAAAKQIEVTAAETASAGFAEAETTLRTILHEVEPLQRTAEEANREVGRWDQQLKSINQTRTKLKEQQDRQKELAKQVKNWSDLATSFGKRGVQALIIDNALPEIQDEANRLLSRMSDNTLQVELSTLRAGKTTASKIETLDIRVSDNAGTRPYELFSGGEAFRINFALRIALSRLLARRAGASLQTLIIDEGFGTQDASGRERLVEAIESVKGEFKLILVISHIEELKEAFPTRIEVTKGPLGSEVSVLA